MTTTDSTTCMNSSQIRTYSDLAATYNENRFHSENGRFLYEIDQNLIRRLIEKTNAKKILDVPTGTGRVLDYLQGFNAEIVGIDATEEMLEIARQVPCNGNTVELLLGDASKLELEPNSFDCLVSLRFFHLFDRKSRHPFASEFARVIKPGGYLLLSFTNGWYGFGYYWLKRILGCKTVYFEYPGELAELFPDFTVVAREGNVLPKQHWLKHSPRLLALATFLTQRFPLNRLCLERFYLLRKHGSNHES